MKREKLGNDMKKALSAILGPFLFDFEAIVRFPIHARTRMHARYIYKHDRESVTS